LIAHALKKSKEWVLSNPDFRLDNQLIKQLDGVFERFLDGEPLAYITGNQYFYGKKFFVTPDTLIPRPETELLVETVIQTLNSIKKPIKIIDVGTGSGCIAVSLALSAQDYTVYATDISFDSLLIAKKNVERYKLQERVFLLNTNLIDSLAIKPSVICANLPYIPSKKLDRLTANKYEPRIALDGGMGGLDVIIHLFSQIKNKNINPCYIFIEIESTQLEKTIFQCEDFFPNASINYYNDLNHQPRLIRIVIE